MTVAVVAAAGVAWRCGCRAALTTSIEMLQSMPSSQCEYQNTHHHICKFIHGHDPKKNLDSLLLLRRPRQHQRGFPRQWHSPRSQQRECGPGRQVCIVAVKHLILRLHQGDITSNLGIPLLGLPLSCCCLQRRCTGDAGQEGKSRQQALLGQAAGGAPQVDFHA